MRKQILTCWLIPFSIVLLIGSNSWSVERTFAFHIDAPRNAWKDTDLNYRLNQVLSRQPDLKVIAAERGSSGMPAFPEDIFAIDSLKNWGAEVGAKYVLAVDVESIRMERRKGFNLPLIFNNYETVGVIEAEIRLLETSRGRLLLAEKIKVEHRGPRAFQATMDDNPDDPDIIINATAKVAFFDQLEDKFCNELSDRIRKVVHLRK